MDGTTTSWNTDGAAKVSESQVDTEPRVRMVPTVQGQGLAGTRKGLSIPKGLRSVLWRKPGREEVREPL